MIYYTYVLRSEKDDKYYIGSTCDLKRRLKSHNNGRVVATRNRRPFKLVYFEAGTDKNKSLLREKYFKSGFGRKFLKNRL